MKKWKNSRIGAQESELKNLSSRVGAQDSELKNRTSRIGAQEAEPKKQNPTIGTQQVNESITSIYITRTYLSFASATNVTHCQHLCRCLSFCACSINYFPLINCVNNCELDDWLPSTFCDCPTSWLRVNNPGGGGVAAPPLSLILTALSCAN